MNGIHDMGGMQDMGPIRREITEPVFHAEWERRIFALFNALDIDWPARREQLELIAPADYLRMSYYEKWLTAIEPLMTKTGMLSSEEIATGKVIGATNQTRHVLSAAEVATRITPVPDTEATVPHAAARFQLHERVRARNLNPLGHTRLPRYVRGKSGTVERVCGAAALQDAVRDEVGERKQRVYTVRFAARQLWGENHHGLDSVYVDLWEDHLEPG
ncbi:MAG TPA: nitrile hydratase subunit beta [Steroidobacteraceae bacterium]|nr:nitrile hydratase subunit beta [Steroidobacteraceae bacterium]